MNRILRRRGKKRRHHLEGEGSGTGVHCPQSLLLLKLDHHVHLGSNGGVYQPMWAGLNTVFNVRPAGRSTGS